MKAPHDHDRRALVAEDVSRRAVLRGIGGLATVAANAAANQIVIAVKRD